MGVGTHRIVEVDYSGFEMQVGAMVEAMGLPKDLMEHDPTWRPRNIVSILERHLVTRVLPTGGIPAGKLTSLYGST